MLSLRCLLIFQFVIWFVGCSDGRPELVPVTGRVTMRGQPLTAGAIIFHPDSANSYQDDKPSSVLQLDGSFTMKTYPFGDGVSPGKYKVTLAPELATRIDRAKYGSEDETPWEIEVPMPGNTHQLFEVN